MQRDLRQASQIVHLLPPWFTNTGKRLVKTPKLYFVDVGLACWLLGIRDAGQVARDPLIVPLRVSPAPATIPAAGAAPAPGGSGRR